MALDLYLLLYFSQCDDSIFIDVDFVWFNEMSANLGDILLMLTSVCVNKLLNLFFP
jgi:hypothetical protein